MKDEREIAKVTIGVGLNATEDKVALVITTSEFSSTLILPLLTATTLMKNLENCVTAVRLIEEK